MEAVSGEAWSSMVSRALGRSSCTEHYATCGGGTGVAYEDGEVVFLYHGDAYSRGPNSAWFRDTDASEVFTAATVQVV